MSLLLPLLIVLNCYASSHDQRAQILLSAKDSKSLKIKINSLNEYKKLETRCDYELSKNLVPSSCYKLKLSKEKSKVIDKACERASYTMTDEVSLSALSPKCANFVNKKNKDIRYSKEEEDPQKYIF